MPAAQSVDIERLTADKMFKAFQPLRQGRLARRCSATASPASRTAKAAHSEQWSVTLKGNVFWPIVGYSVQHLRDDVFWHAESMRYRQ